MATATTSAVPQQTPNIPPSGPMDGPPIIEGFNTDPRFRDETFQEKLRRKTRDNPFVPVGCLATAGALIYGLRAFQQGKTHQSQIMMRGRIAAQGFTLVALIVGVFATALTPKK